MFSYIFLAFYKCSVLWSVQSSPDHWPWIILFACKHSALHDFFICSVSSQVSTSVNKCELSFHPFLVLEQPAQGLKRGKEWWSDSNIRNLGREYTDIFQLSLHQHMLKYWAEESSEWSRWAVFTRDEPVKELEGGGGWDCHQYLLCCGCSHSGFSLWSQQII
jgi:hypothetical protein